jgi:hypothetical protein
MKKYFLLAFSLLFGISQSQIIRKYSNEFLNIGAGARGLAMGGAVISNQDDVYSLCGTRWINGRGKRLAGSSNARRIFRIYRKIRLSGLCKSSGKGVFGVSVVRLGVDNILNTTQLIDSEGNIDYDKITNSPSPIMQQFFLMHSIRRKSEA